MKPYEKPYNFDRTYDFDR